MSDRPTPERPAQTPDLNMSIARYIVDRVAADEAELGAEASANAERINWAGSILNIPSVWRQTRGTGVRVAVLDTGIDTDHPDLADAIVAQQDFSGDGIEDANGHGTHCAGIIGARLNGVGFAGVAPECSLIVGKVLDDEGRGANAWLIDAIYWAVEQKARIISMSLGGPGSDPYLYKAIQYALHEGVHLFCAAGNSGSLNTNSIDYPGRYGGVMTIGSHDRNGNPSGFTSRGGEVDLMGPGTDIWSTWINGGYATISGTSMATPFVAGLAALVLADHRDSGSSNPLNNTEDMRNHLLFMATHPGYHDNREGYGALQPLRYF